MAQPKLSHWGAVLGRMPRSPILLLAAVVLALTATPAAASEKAIWGPETLPNGASAFPTYHQLGVDTYQSVISWATIAPQRPQHPTDPADPAYQWPAAMDFIARQARTYRIRVAVMITQAPGWANGGRPPIWAPTNPRDFANFATAASRKYPSVRRWMIWGEPSRHEVFEPVPNNKPTGPRIYARILDAAYGALKRQSRRNIVIGGMTFTT